MSDTYTKLFRSITASTIVSEPVATRWLWVTMLSQADSSGCVWGSVPGLARLANITLPECEAALLCFYSPDHYSRTQDNEGRRIESIDGGWRLLNHAKYDAIRNEAERAEYKRQWDRDHRPSGYARKSGSPTQSDTVRQNPTKPDSPTPPTPTPTLQKQDQKLTAHPSAARFGDWWAAYPKKIGKKPAEQKWRSRGLDSIAETLIADVLNRIANDDGWQRGYIPDPCTYLNQDRWGDDLRKAPIAGAGPSNAAPSKTLNGMKSLQGLKHGNGLVHERDSRRADQAHVLELGSDARLRLGTDHGGDVD